MNRRAIIISVIIILLLSVHTFSGIALGEDFVMSQIDKETVQNYPVIYVAIEKASFPFEFYNNYEKQYEGVIVQILKKVSYLTGFKFEYIYTKNSNETLQFAYNMQTDITTSFVRPYSGFKAGREIASFDGNIIAIQYTSRMPNQAIELMNRAIDTISQEQIVSIISSQAVQYEKMFDDTKLNIVIATSVAVVSITALVSAFTAYKKCKKLKQQFLNTDKLTGYPNLTGLKSITDITISSLNISSYCMVNFVVSSLDNIREIFGYDEANKVQVDVALIIDEYIYNNEILARADNDDFILLLQFTEKPEMALRIKQIIDAINDKFDIKKSEYPVVLSIGIYTPKYEEVNMDMLMQKSLQARRFVKETDEIRFLFFDETAHIVTIEENLLQQEFTTSMEKEDFLIYIQPKISLKDNSICGGEILSRWYNPRRGLIRPGEYIPVFEKSGSIIAFDMYMFEKACKLIAKSMKEGKRVVPVAINFARSHFADIKFCDDILDIAQRYEVPASLLNIEVTESIISENKKIMIEIVKRLKEYGFTISLDDFGTGYASFSDLSSFTIDYLKLDKSLLYNLDNSRTKKMIKGISDIAHNMDMKVICEGVETKEQLDSLRLLECDIIQGFFFYPPMPYEEFEKILQSV